MVVIASKAKIGVKMKDRILKNIRNLVIENNDMSTDQKIVFCIIVILSGARGFCWVSNVSLSRSIDLSVCEIRKIVESLEKLELIHIEKKGNTRRLWIKGEYEEDFSIVDPKKV